MNNILEVAHRLRTMRLELADADNDGICGDCVVHFMDQLQQCAIALTSIADQINLNADILEKQLKILEIEE